MIKVSVLYPRKTGARFDFNYYAGTHLPLLRSKLGAACKGIVVDRGLRGAAPRSPSPFILVANMVFENMDEFRKAFRPHAEEISNDIVKFTDIRPIVQVSEMTPV